MPDATFEYDGAPIEIVGGAPYAAGLGIIDIPMFEGFDPDNAVKHFRFKFHATQDAPEALYYFKVQFYNSDMEASDDWSGVPITIQDGWIGEAGESWGSGPESENRSTFVSDHAHYSTTEGDLTPPYFTEVYEAEDGGSFWTSYVIDTAKKNSHLPAGGDWFLRISLPDGTPGNVTLHDFSFEMTYQEWKPRNFIGPIPLTEGWVCSNDYPAPLELWLIIHRGVAHMYGNMLDWSNWNETEDEEWFPNFYDDYTTKLVDTGGVPEEARPASNTLIPFRWYPFDRSSTVMEELWNLSINTDGSITFISPSSKRLRVGGGDYSFAPMQIRWPIADQTHGPDTGVGSDVVWEVHNELVNEGESSGETWEWANPIEITAHGGIAHLKGGVSKEGNFYSVPLWESGGIEPFDEDTPNLFNAVKVHLDTPGAGQDFGFIQQFGSESIITDPGSATVQFDASPSHGNEPLTYEWDFGDGNTGTGINPIHSYHGADTYSVTLTVTDERGRTGSATKEVLIESGDLGNPTFGQPWSTYVNENGGIINSAGQRIIFLSGDPDTQVFKGGHLGPWVPGEAGSSGDDPLDATFAVNKYLLANGTRQAEVSCFSPGMPEFSSSAIGRKYGVAICIQDNGDHYRHEVECTAIPGGTRPNTYTHKLFKHVGGADTQIGSTITNNLPNCNISAQISLSDVESIRYIPSGTTISVDNSDVSKSGGWGYYHTEDITISLIEVTGNDYPLLPADDEVVTFDCWWPVEYEFDEPSS